MKRLAITAVILSITFVMSGCSMFRIGVSDKDPSTTGPLGAKYDQGDLISWTDEIAQKIVAAPFPSPSDKKPVVVSLGIQNRTKSHLDTKAMTDTIRTKLMDLGKIDFVNAGKRDELLKEQKYQQQHASHETRVKIGKQLGAKYMLTGSLVEIERKSGRQVRVSKQQDVYYQLTIEITDLETGLIKVSKQAQRMRRASKPIIGW